MALRLYNVRTRGKEEFRPRDPARVTVYVCGLTVYDHAHIGHARTAVSFEVARRWLEHRYPGKVTFVQNVTDVDDKIIARAKETGVSPREHAAKWDKECALQMARLGVRPPDHAPHVTQSIPGIVGFIHGILANGFAYATPAGNVYFDVPKYDAHAATQLKDAGGRPCGYGSLSNRDYREMAAGTRKEVEGDKRHPADFALWKAGDDGDHPDANWDSPWGKGRPGWHIECSYMSTHLLGDQIDLHGGGQDLVFPHHENEIAQTQAKTGKAPFVEVWMHSGFLNVEGEKMSKSLGNFIPLKEALDDLERRWLDPEVLRLYYVQTHYRSKIDYSQTGLESALGALANLQRVRGLLYNPTLANRPGEPSVNEEVVAATSQLRLAFDEAMDDDLHTPTSLAAIFAFAKRVDPLISRQLGSQAAKVAHDELTRCGRILTLFARDSSSVVVPEVLRAATAKVGIPFDGGEVEIMERMVEARAAARAAKDWKRGDAIRDAAKAAGYLIEDTPAGQRWRRA